MILPSAFRYVPGNFRGDIETEYEPLLAAPDLAAKGRLEQFIHRLRANALT